MSVYKVRDIVITAAFVFIHPRFVQSFAPMMIMGYN